MTLHNFTRTVNEVYIFTFLTQLDPFKTLYVLDSAYFSTQSYFSIVERLGKFRCNFECILVSFWSLCYTIEKG